MLDESSRVQKFTLDGVFVGRIDNHGSINPRSIDMDSYGNIYIVDYGSSQIRKFTYDGELITQWGDSGTSPGHFLYPKGLAVSDKGDYVYVGEWGNHRVQKFKVVTLANNIKTIIVAGGGAFPGNNFWNATQMNANYAYRALTYQGFTKESIYYLTSDTDLDLDNNGELDDVDANATNSNLQEAITSWASDADSLVLYLVNHGGDGTFRMSGHELLSAADLDTWLDQVQGTISGKVIVVYDACESGSFLSALTPPEGKERILISSTSPGENANFITQGSVSFSNYFWTHIFNGLNVKDAFDLTRSAMLYPTELQHPLLDDNGNGIGNEKEDGALASTTYIGNGTTIQGDAPLIGSVSSDQTISGTNLATLSAMDVTDDDGMARVWAVIRPPDYRQGTSGNPVQDLPSVDLMPVEEGQYEAAYDGFNAAGTYQIAIYARDRIGNTSIPKVTTVSVENPLRRRAIIVGGGGQTDELWPAVSENVKLAYGGLSFQGYSDEDIYLLAPASIPEVSKLTLLPTLDNIEYAIATWAADSTLDVMIYLIGSGGDGTFEVNATELLASATLDSWIDSLQESITGKVTVIYDACRSGSFVQALSPPTDKKRILLASTGSDQPAYFISNGAISFSKFFWSRIANGTNIRDSFNHAKMAMAFLTKNQTPQIDDNGNGIANEKIDGYLSRGYTLGVGIMLAGDDPLIGSVSPEQMIVDETSATIWAKDVTTTGTIERVWAVITPYQRGGLSADSPVIDLPEVELTFNTVSEQYEGSLAVIAKNGEYGVTVYAQDTESNISMPRATRVIKGIPLQGDINGDGSVDLTDAIIALKTIVGMYTTEEIRSDYQLSSFEVNGDNMIGFSEVIYIMLHAND